MERLSLVVQRVVLLTIVFLLSGDVAVSGGSGFGDAYEFRDVKVMAHNKVKDQGDSGTCWAFSTLSMIESDMIASGRDTVELSEMYVIAMSYIDKVRQYIRMHGKILVGEGAEFHDAVSVWKRYGLVPRSVYWMGDDTTRINHERLAISVDSLAREVVFNGKIERSKPKEGWEADLNSLIERYIGKIPTEFEWSGRKYTPRSFADEVVGLDPDDYVAITSFSHHPFYEKFVFEIPDNWSFGEEYNLPIEVLEEAVDSAIERGRTVAWAADVTEKYISCNLGIGVYPQTDPDSMSTKDRRRWRSLPDFSKEFYGLEFPVEEGSVSQVMRQEAFDSYETTDDHGMHIVGKALDKNGKEYYKVKNSWGPSAGYGGYVYVSKRYFEYKTMHVLMNRQYIPKVTRERMKI